MSEWKEYEVKTLIKKELLSIGDGYRAKNSELSDEGIPFARAGNLNGGFEFSNCDRFPTENIRKVGEKKSHVGDVVFTSKGTVGRFAFVDDKTPEFVFSPQLCYWRSLDESFIYPRFLYYWMQSRAFTAQIYAVKGQTDMADYVSLRDQRHMRVALPEIRTQKEIAFFLSNLDQKTTLLRRQNQTLEKIAQALFRRWFVDFEFPDEQGQPYRSAGGKMVASELGEVPEGWEVGDLYDLIEVDYGFPFKSELFNEIKEGLPLIRIRDLKNGDGSFYTTEKYDYKYIIEPGDVLAGMDAEFKPYLWSGNKALLNQRVCRFKPKKKFVSNVFIFELIKPHLHFYEKTKAGTTVIHLGKSDIDQFEIIQPDENTLSEFKKIADPLLQKYINNNREIQTLTQTRDTLLPKLMSGQIRIPTT